MGLFIGNKNSSPRRVIDVNIVGGFTTDDGYVNISEYYRRKDGNKLDIGIRMYKSKADRAAGKPPVQSTDFSSNLSIDCTVEELEVSNLFNTAYSKLSTYLETVFGEGNIFDDV